MNVRGKKLPEWVRCRIRQVAGRKVYECRTCKGKILAGERHSVIGASDSLLKAHAFLRECGSPVRVAGLPYVRTHLNCTPAKVWTNQYALGEFTLHPYVEGEEE